MIRKKLAPVFFVIGLAICVSGIIFLSVGHVKRGLSPALSYSMGSIFLLLGPLVSVLCWEWLRSHRKPRKVDR